MAAVIALDAMGGDDAPGPEVAGAVSAVRDHGHRVILLGDEPRLQKELSRLSATHLHIPVRHCTEVITMSDSPGQAARSKRDSSMRMAFDLVKRNEAQAVVSAGNSGAMLACGLLFLGRLPGVERPGILVSFPTLSRGARKRGDGDDSEQVVLLDMGANVECKPVNLAQFAVLGATFARLHGGKLRPRVGLLSNGEEHSKGTELLREAHALLSRPFPGDFEYAGYVEGQEIFDYRRDHREGGLDVVVTDGFTGNVVLKTAEGAARLLSQVFEKQVRASLLARLGALLMMPTLRAMKRLIDIERRGGAVLIGVDGVVIICHGRSSPRAICNAITLAHRQVLSGMSPQVAAAIARHQPLWAQEDPP